jgi:hypothetical protein
MIDKRIYNIDMHIYMRCAPPRTGSAIRSDLGMQVCQTQPLLSGREARGHGQPGEKIRVFPHCGLMSVQPYGDSYA